MMLNRSQSMARRLAALRSVSSRAILGGSGSHYRSGRSRGNGTSSGWRKSISPFLAYGFAGGVGIACSQCDAKPNPHGFYTGAVKPELFGGCVRRDQIEDDVAECHARGKPWSSYHPPTAYPDLIIFPESTSDVSNVLKVCNKLKIPVVAIAGGTSLEGQVLTSSGGISLDFTHMKKVLEVNERDLDCTVQPGLGYLELNDKLADRGIWFPLDPGPGAAIGGMCACRCSGSTAVRYGSMRDNVLSLVVVLADGTIVKTGGKARKSSAGYDLTRLFIGSEGTLGIVTEATLKLHTIPSHSYAMKITFPDIASAAATARDTLRCGVAIGRCELLDQSMVEIMNRYYRQPGLPDDEQDHWREEVTLLYEIVGISDSSVREQLDIVSNVAESHGSTAWAIMTNKADCKQLWRKRKEAIWATMGQYPDREPMITDAAVPLSGLPELIAASRQWLDESGLPSPIIAHAGDGNFHAVIMIRSQDEAEVQKARDLSARMALKAISLGGTCTGEHGIGAGKIELLKVEMGPGAIRLMKDIKHAINPSLILNPGKIFDNLEREDDTTKEKEQ